MQTSLEKAQPALNRLPLLLLVTFLLIEVFYGALLFSGFNYGGDAVELFYGIRSPTSSEVYTTDNHAQSILWFTLPLASLTYSARSEPAKLSRLLSHVGLIVLTMTGLLVGMGSLQNGGKLVFEEYKFSIFLNVALIVAIGFVTSNVTPIKVIGSPCYPSSPAHKAVLFTSVINAILFYFLVLGDRSKFHDGEINDRTSGLAWVAASLLFAMLIGRFTLTYGRVSDAVAHAKATLTVVVVNEMYQTFWSFNRFPGDSQRLVRVVHAITASVLMWGIRASHSSTPLKPHFPRGVNPIIPVVAFAANQLWWSFRLLHNPEGVYDIKLTNAERFQAQIQGLSILWSLIPFVSSAFALASKPSDLASLCTTIQHISLSCVGMLLALGKRANGGLIDDTTFGASVAVNLFLFGLAHHGRQNNGTQNHNHTANGLSPARLALLAIVGFNIFYYLDLAFSNGKKFNSDLKDDRTRAATSWISLNILHVIFVLRNVIKFGSDNNARHVAKTFVFVIFLTETLNHTIGSEFIPTTSKIELFFVHAFMALSLAWGIRSKTIIATTTPRRLTPAIAKID